MKVQEVMSSDIRSCTPGTNLAEAAAMLWEEDCGALPVVADGKVEGIITDRDICIALGTRDRVPHEMTVAEVESRNPTTCHPNDELSRAMAAMRQAKVRRIPVVNSDGTLQGMLSVNDIVLRVGRTAKNGLSYEQVINTLQSIAEHRSPEGESRSAELPAYAAH